MNLLEDPQVSGEHTAASSRPNAANSSNVNNPADARTGADADDDNEIVDGPTTAGYVKMAATIRELCYYYYYLYCESCMT